MGAWRDLVPKRSSLCRTRGLMSIDTIWCQSTPLLSRQTDYVNISLMNCNLSPKFSVFAKESQICFICILCMLNHCVGYTFLRLYFRFGEKNRSPSAIDWNSTLNYLWYLFWPWFVFLISCLSRSLVRFKDF